MKIAFVSYNLINGGAQRVLSILGTELVRNHEVMFILGSRMENEYYFSNNIIVRNLFSNDLASKLHSKYNLIKKIRTYLKEFDADIVVPFMGFAEETFLACIGTRIHYISAVRNNPASSPTSIVRRAVRNFLVYISSACIVQNESQKQYFNKLFHAKIFVLPNPIGDEYIYTSDHTYGPIRKIVTFGRLVDQKNHKLLIDAFIKVIAKIPSNCVLEIYGNGPLREQLDHYIESNKVQNRVKILEYTHDPLSIYKASDLFVLSSNYEGMPNSLLEAMTLGLPCISTDCPTGPGEMIKDHYNGILVPVDDVSSMAGAILEFLDNPQLAIKLGSNARKQCIVKYEKGLVANCFIDQIMHLCNLSN